MAATLSLEGARFYLADYVKQQIRDAEAEARAAGIAMTGTGTASLTGGGNVEPLRDATLSTGMGDGSGLGPAGINLEAALFFEITVFQPHPRYGLSVS